MLPFQTVGKHCRDSFYIVIHLKEIVLQVMILVFLTDEKCSGHDKCQHLRNADRTPDTVDPEPEWKCQDHDDLEH